jgi:PKD repeat protein
MAFKERIKELYYAIEDRYYGVLDKINKVIPIYKIIDPIDKHVPSLLLFTGIILIILLWMFILPMFALPEEKVFTATIRVLDATNSEPLKNVTVMLYIPETGDYLSETTDEEGVAEFELPSETLEGKITISIDGYEEVKSRGVTLIAGETREFFLRPVGIVFANVIEIYVLEKAPGSKKIDDRTITITFSCEYGTAPAAINKHGSEQPFKVEKPIGCEGFSATASAAGYKSETLSLEGKETAVFKLEPIKKEEKTGSLEVTVYEHDGSFASDVIVRIYDATTSSPIAQKTTDASGTVLFEKLKPGHYDIGIVSNDGRTSTKSNVRVIAEQRTQSSLTLPAPEQPEPGYKLFFKVVDGITGTPITTADVFIYSEHYFIAKVRPDTSGIVNYLINESEKDYAFRAMVAHPNYVSSVVLIPVLERTVTEPTIVELAPRGEHDIGYAPIALFTADKYFGQPPLTITFDASSSFDPDGTIVSYEWDFGDGSTANGISPSHIFREEGTYLVTLRVLDENSLSSETSVIIQVGLDSYAPVAIIRADKYFGQPPLTITFDASSSFDPDGTIVSYEWDFGDGNTDSDVTAIHTYTTAGVYMVRLTVVDDNGKSDNVTMPIQIRSTPAPSTGRIIVKTVDLENNPVAGARINLYREDVPFPINPPGTFIYTNENGEYTFENIEPNISAYYVKAMKDNLFGESQHLALSAGSTLTLKVVMAYGYGELKVKVVDANNNPVDNASVTFYDSANNSVESRCTTNLGGECSSGPIKAGKIIYAKASKENYSSLFSDEIQIVANNLHEATLTLYPKTADSGIDIVFSELCKDWRCERHTSQVVSLSDEENYYYAKFYLKLFANESENAMVHIRVGLDSEQSLPADNYKVRILEVRSPLANTFYSTCYDSNEPFNVPEACAANIGSGSKMVKLHWSRLSGLNGVIVPIVVKLGIESGLSYGENIDIRYLAKATQAGTQVDVEEKLQRFTIGKQVCTSNAIIWLFKLYSNGDLIDEEFQISEPTVLTLGQDYKLEFTLKNCTDKDYTDSRLTVWDENVADAIEFPELGSGSGPFTLYENVPALGPGKELNDYVMIRAANIASFTRVSFKVHKGTDVPAGGIVSVLFRILSGRGMVLEGLPDSLPPEMPIVLDGYVKDVNTGAGIANASVDIFLNEDKLATITTESDGHFRFEQPSNTTLPKVGDAVRVNVSHPNYDDVSVLLPIRRQVVVGISCVTVKPSEPMRLQKGSSGNFTIETKDCPEKVAIKIESMLSVNQKELVMEKTETKTIGFEASGPLVYQGIYPIYVGARFLGASEYRNAGIVEAIVNDPNSCFVMEDYIYDLKAGKVTGIIRNKCLYPNNDPTMPIINIANSAVELLYGEIPAGITFKWRIKAEATEFCAGGQNNISVVAYETTQSVDLTKGYTFDLVGFDVADYIEGNPSKGIQGLRQAASSPDCKLCDVKFIPESDDPRVTVWIEGNKVMGRFIGNREESGSYTFTLTNRGLKNTQYTFIGIDDYVVR